MPINQVPDRGLDKQPQANKHKPITSQGQAKQADAWHMIVETSSAHKTKRYHSPHQYRVQHTQLIMTQHPAALSAKNKGEVNSCRLTAFQVLSVMGDPVRAQKLELHTERYMLCTDTI